MIAIFNEVFFAAIAAEDRLGFIGISSLFFFLSLLQGPRREPGSLELVAPLVAQR